MNTGLCETSWRVSRLSIIRFIFWSPPSQFWFCARHNSQICKGFSVAPVVLRWQLHWVRNFSLFRLVLRASLFQSQVHWHKVPNKLSLISFASNLLWSLLSSYHLHFSFWTSTLNMWYTEMMVISTFLQIVQHGMTFIRSIMGFLVTRISPAVATWIDSWIICFLSPWRVNEPPKGRGLKKPIVRLTGASTLRHVRQNLGNCLWGDGRVSSSYHFVDIVPWPLY